MGIQKIAINFMVERGGKLAKSLLCKKPVLVPINFKGLKYAPALEKDTVQISKKVIFDEELSKAIDWDNFKNFKMFRKLNEEEKLLAHQILTPDEGQYKVFLATVKGYKPSCLLTVSAENPTRTGTPFEFLEKCIFDKGIDFVHRPNLITSDGITIYNTYILNKKSVTGVIERNKKFFTSRLSLPNTAENNEIYSKVLEMLGSNKLSQDIEGLILGFPKKSSIIFNLEHVAGATKYRIFGDVVKLKTKLLEALYSANSIYKNLSKEEIKSIEKVIHDITNDTLLPMGYNDGLYQFVKYVDEPTEFFRIKDSFNKFKQNFNILDL